MVLRITFFMLAIPLYLFSETPDWVFNPNADKNYIGGVGSSNSGNFYRDMRIAKMLARADLSQNIAVEVESVFTSINGKSDYTTVQKSNSLLKNSFVKDEWRSPDGELFIWIVIERGLK